MSTLVPSLAPVRLLASPNPPVSDAASDIRIVKYTSQSLGGGGCNQPRTGSMQCGGLRYLGIYLGPHESGHGTWHDRFSCAAAAALHASLHAEEHRCCFGFGWDVPQALKKQVEAWRNGLADDYAKMKKLAPWVDGQSVAYSQGLCSARGSADCLRACRCMGAYQEGAGGKSPARPEETEGAALLGSAAPSVFWCSEYA